MKKKKRTQKDTFLKRIARGLVVMYKKIAGSDYVQSIKEEQQETTSMNDMLPPELLPDKNTTSDPDEFATKF